MKPPGEDNVNILPPAVTVHSLPQAQAAVAAGRPVTLLSAPGAVRYAGCLWWAELLRAAAWDGPAFLDCADATGRALEALRLGLRGIVLDAPDDLFAIVAAEAAATGAVVLRAAPPALDLGQRNAARRLLAWLGADDTAGRLR